MSDTAPNQPSGRRSGGAPSPPQLPATPGAPPPPPTVTEVADPAPSDDLVTALLERLSRARMVGRVEADLQRGIADILYGLGVAFTREAPLGADLGRIDFLAGRIGIEAKTQGSSQALGRQLTRYAQSSAIATLIVVTTRRHHRRDLPPRIGRIPVHVIVIDGLA